MAEFRTRLGSVNQLAALVRDARRNRHWTQQQLAQSIGCSRAWITNLEQGRIPDPGLLRVLALCRVLGIELTASYNPESQSTAETTAMPRRTRRSARADGEVADEGKPKPISPTGVAEAASILEEITMRCTARAMIKRFKEES